MKLMYIALCDLSAYGEVGIRNKVFSQIKSLGKKFDAYLVTLNNMVVHTYRNDKIIEKKVLLSLATMLKYIDTFIAAENIEVIYIRYLQTNYYMNNFLKIMKKSKRKVIIDFPTIPYDMEIEGRVELEEDKLYRNYLKKYVSYSANYNGLDTVFGIPSVSIQNGINIEDIPQKSCNKTKFITLIAVATMNYWHGYDRLIKGVADYYSLESQPIKIYVKLIGKGKEIPRYIELVKKYHIEKYVLFEGIKQGEELEKEFDEANIAIGSLGMNRIKLKEGSPIKTKEYCARGLPIVLGYNDLAFPREENFLYKVPNDESNIDILKLLQFYKEFSENSGVEEIRRYAEENLTWDTQFERLFYKFNNILNHEEV